MSKAISLTVKDANKLAKSLSLGLRGGEILGLVGPLGAGKTTFTKALAKSLKVKGKLRSPTFILMQSFKAKLPGNKSAINLHHLDLYRLNTQAEIKTLGLEDFMGKQDSITVIEWADRAKKYLPKKTIYIHFLPLGTSYKI